MLSRRSHFSMLCCLAWNAQLQSFTLYCFWFKNYLMHADWSKGSQENIQYDWCLARGKYEINISIWNLMQDVTCWSCLTKFGFLIKQFSPSVHFSCLFIWGKFSDRTILCAIVSHPKLSVFVSILVSHYFYVSGNLKNNFDSSIFFNYSPKRELNHPSQLN